MLRNILSVILLAVISPVISWGADTPTQLLTQAAEQFRKAPSVKANYTLTSSAGGRTAGAITFAGEKFHMTSPELTTWYDGTTQWTLVTADGEVTISEPTADELQMINPFVVINTFRNAYTAKMLKSTATAKKISLTAKNKKADIKSATVTINPSTHFPSEITLNLSNAQSVTIRITDISTGKALPISTFRFNPKQYPKASIIDLR